MKVSAKIIYRLASDDNGAFCDRPVNVLVAQEGAKMQQNALADDLNIEPVPVMQWIGWVHAA